MLIRQGNLTSASYFAIIQLLTLRYCNRMAEYYLTFEDYEESNKNTDDNADLDYYPRTGYYESLSNNYYCNYGH